MRNIDFRPVQPPELHSAEMNTAGQSPAGHTGHRLMF